MKINIYLFIRESKKKVLQSGIIHGEKMELAFWSEPFQGLPFVLIEVSQVRISCQRQSSLVVVLRLVDRVVVAVVGRFLTFKKEFK